MILGATGMLGSMVADFFVRNRRNKVILTTRGQRTLPPVLTSGVTVESFDAEPDGAKNAIHDLLARHRPDYVINCIGIIKPHCKDDDPQGRRRAILVNALFPSILLAESASSGANVIQIATDCVYSGRQGNYLEDDAHDALDVYGKTKSLGEVHAPNFLNIRCSIIGPELKNHLSLFAWFRRQPDGCELSGFAHHRWNGITTLEYAQLCYAIINNRHGLEFASLTACSSIHHYLPNETVTKYSLLNILAKECNKNVRIKRVTDIGEPIDRTLDSSFSLLAPEKATNSMRRSIAKLLRYMDLSPVWKH